VPERKMVGGICLHADGGLVVSGPDLSHVRDGRSRVLLELADVPARPGTRAVGFNDIEADRDGALFAGVLRKDGAGAYVCGELVKVTGAGCCDVVHDDLQPNGIALSPDGSRLYAADTFHRRILVFDIAGDAFPAPAGEVSTLTLPGAPDGVAVDEEGCIWVAFYKGGCVARFTAEGRLAERVEVPAIKPLSLCIGAEELYVVTGQSEPGAADAGTILRTPIEVGPAPVYPARV
jgi:sugar lactone lactonase YvrE